ncbi:hypothetical protein THAOC_33848 [Thalassiosira oceanica]|uniref:Uncharacterized protein n=1 Tax=Thalassiosira oceanica TaxID=159749 RepID=K0RL61_THAOC|nr:hypothetical protein THAOC_33848 [Thalassiosira oceanica]|eukprot:EJK47432.1 hypothetical protein THAOC_33848 [Thalassiosira oceanica]
MLEVRDLLTAFEHFQGMIGKPGPYFFDCQVIAHNHFCGNAGQGASDVFQIGEAGRDVEPEDIFAALRAAAQDEVLTDVRSNYGRSYYHEGFRLSSDGKTVRMIWGS